MISISQERSRLLLDRRQAMSARARSLRRFLVAAAVIGALWAASEAKAEEPVPAPERRIVRFEDLPGLEKREGPHPRNVWVYGRFTARMPVSGGVFLASVNEGVNLPDWEENFSFLNNPGDFVFRRVVFRTNQPLPEIRKGTKLAVSRDRPAKLLEVARVDGIIARLALESAPTIESQDGAGRAGAWPPKSRAGNGAGGYPPRRIVPFRELGAIAKAEGVHPENVWTWGRFSARSNLREGIVSATPAGMETRRALETGISAALTFYLPYLAYLVVGAEEPVHRVIFRVYQPKTIQYGDLIEVTKESPARVKRIFTAGGILAWLDLDPPVPVAIPVELGNRGRESASPAALLRGGSPERVAAE
ncbi:conserved protein of unknown function [Methylacidimicrobium sp. AP8]|uniref:hypothetical protein n=1 Tax=Methylacidimicrobium sp. AP8 TaxID=2730359 RepID=UPI0018C1354A|nr:hypothetical protein [Methylacidimicrobium sp. AP8]CAB4242392.1 conserved protein of unknown function [Methylacidimicrobium sp. AP8]